MKRIVRGATILGLLTCFVVAGGGVLARQAEQESPAQSAKLLEYAAQLDNAAQKARLAGQERAAKAAAQQADTHGSAEQLIDQRVKTRNGIYVDTPKVYDDALLEQMLESSQQQLASLQGFDQSGLTRAIGTVTGANQAIAGFGISGGVQPPVVQTEYGNVGSPFPAPSATPPAPTTTLPTPTSPAASDILNEQLQITSQITNLRLMLEGSLSDQIMVGRDETFAKPRITLGFPVVISPEKHYKNAVAVIEVLVETNSKNDASSDGEAPSIMALLPREKTYNVASISDKSFSLGGGIATATAGAAASFLWGHKQYFIVKDQDTVASQFQPEESEIALISARQPAPLDGHRVRAFAWEFRPVLGRPFVQEGTRQVFVQLAFPGRGLAPAVKSFGTVYVRTYWRRVDSKTGVLGDVIPGSLDETARTSAIPNYDMHQRWGAVASFNPADMEDQGGGKMLIKLDGRLLPGTYLRIGANVIRPGAAGAPSDIKTTRFLADIADLATLQTFVISRDGTEYPLKIQPGVGNQFRVDRAGVTVTPLDDATVLLRVPVANINPVDDIPPVFVIGGKVFGYADAPIERDCNAAAGTCTLSVALPRGFLADNPLISVKALMMDEDGMAQAAPAATRTFAVFGPAHVEDKIVFINQDAAAATYLVYGHDLNNAEILWPEGNADPVCPRGQLCFQAAGAGQENDGTLKLLKLPLSLAKEANSILVKREGANEKPFVVSLPALPSETGGAAPAEAEPGPRFTQRVVVGADDGTIVGTKLAGVVSAAYAGRTLRIAAQSPSSLRIAGLAAAGASAQAHNVNIVLTDRAGKQTTVPLEVVSSRVEVLSK